MVGLGIAVAALLWMGIAYPGVAHSSGWKQGSWVGSNGWYGYFGIGVLTLISTLWHEGKLITLVPAVIGGFFLAFAVTMLLRRNAPLLALLGPPAAFGWFLSLSEICAGTACRGI